MQANKNNTIGTHGKRLVLSTRLLEMSDLLDWAEGRKGVGVGVGVGLVRGKSHTLQAALQKMYIHAGFASHSPSSLYCSHTESLRRFTQAEKT